MIFTILKLSLFFGPLMVALTGVAINCYIAFRDMDVVLGNFKNSYAITSFGGGGRSFFSRCILASIVSGGVLWPSRHIRNGTLDPEELARLPVSIKCRMKWAVVLVYSGVICLFAVFIGAEIFRWSAA